MKLSDSISVVKGVGEKTAKAYEKLRVYTIEDMIEMYPRNYLSYNEPVDIEEAPIGERVAIKANINSYVNVISVRGMKMINVKAKDFTGDIKLTWFNQPYLKQVFSMGATYIFVGYIQVKKGQKVMTQPEYYTVEKYQGMTKLLQPVYSLKEGITNNMIKKHIKEVVPLINHIEDYIPDILIDRLDLYEYSKAIFAMHFPEDIEELKLARNRMVFDEFFIFLLAMKRVKEKSVNLPNNYVIKKTEDYDRFISELPYSLTKAQINTLEDIMSDISSDMVMNRLVQGDVGSGKTIVAMIALLMCVKSGYQGALMVPTEVLAVQHYESFTTMLKNYNVKVELLIGSTKLKDKRRIYDELEAGSIDILIGTHAIIQDKVIFNNLALVVTDEQHRFGVKQRETLSKKGSNPHVLVMSATPIPRTLAIILYGDLDISIIDELPANRLPIKNCVVGTNYRATAYKFIGEQCKIGHQVYIICPMVKGQDTLEVENVTDYTEELENVFNHTLRIRALHGKMSNLEKNSIMEEYAAGNIDILVSTTVIEVGINVPNATVMMIENAERFGLAQLHQLRGRVGRGDAQSYCIMMCGNENSNNMKRLEILNTSNDGFYIANEDLKLRGGGDFFGVRQSGDVLFRLADIYQDADILKQAKEAVDILEEEQFDVCNINNTKLDKKVVRALNL